MKSISILPKAKKPSIGALHPAQFLIGLLIITTFIFVGLSVTVFRNSQADHQKLSQQNSGLLSDKKNLADQLASISDQLQNAQNELTQLKGEDQRKRNDTLTAEIKSIQTTYQAAAVSYEKLSDLHSLGGKTQPLDTQFALVLTQLSKQNYASASATLATLNSKVDAMTLALAVPAGISTANLPASNTPPSSGYARQSVNSDAGAFAVDVLTADLNSTRVSIETASSGDCHDNCPVNSLASYVGKSGGYAGINGPYFCPAESPHCAGKTGSFDTLLMNKSKTYFNSDNNVYSTVPAMIFSGGSVRLVGQSLEWGRDTGVDGVMAAQPMLVSGGNITFGGSSDPKQGSRGNRSFIAYKGSQLYIGVVHGATVAEVARVLKAMGVDGALNLDSGGSVAFMVNGKYVDGPGRNTPFGIVLVRK
ncbi:hypothetical protein BH10PAT2_BH10PAT2_2320 [soil metagenome]